MTAHLYLDRQSTGAYRAYRVYVDGLEGYADHIYAGLVLQNHHGGRWTSGPADPHSFGRRKVYGHTTRAQAVNCLLRRVSQPHLVNAT